MKSRSRVSSSDDSSLASSSYFSRQESNMSLSSSLSYLNTSRQQSLSGSVSGGMRSPFISQSSELSSNSATFAASTGKVASSKDSLNGNLSSSKSVAGSLSANSAPMSSKKLIKASVSTLPHHKAGRVKVGIRCRPAFQDEIDFAEGNFFSIVECRPGNMEQTLPGQLSLTLLNGKQRDFMFDYVFDENSSQDYVYDTIARPVVSDVLRGFNGTIFAYGQTGTGKTYTMGILEFVNNEHAGIIPRAVYQIFEYVDQQSHENNDITISLSFLQLYRETIQDLLAPISRDSQSSGGNDENLNIREDPLRGFYVEGLQEYVIRSYSEAEALLNVGLENRAIAPTLMNTTSSRSHTVLTLHIEQRGLSDSDGSLISGTSYARTVRSKLLMVDLAGSERVRRTVSKGPRLLEAQSINSSLSALGNVIAALATGNAAHIPYRDSKLTRLLQDSLGGTASTALVAAVGPAPINYGETLSTIQFAVRCMAVKTTPIKHEEVDYAELCARLQEKLSTLEGSMTSKMLEQQNNYEKMIYNLTMQLDAKNRQEASQSRTPIENVQISEMSLTNTNKILEYFNAKTGVDGKKPNSLGGDQNGWISSLAKKVNTNDPKAAALAIDQLTVLVSYCFDTLYQISVSTGSLLRENVVREEKRKDELAIEFEKEHENDRLRDQEKSTMDAEDPMRASNSNALKVGSHLAPLSKLEAMTRIEGLYRSSNDPVSASDRRAVSEKKLQDSVTGDILKYGSPQDVANVIAQMRQVTIDNLSSVETLFDRKDKHFSSLKEELSSQLVERRRREEEVVNWSYILKYLLAASSKLRRQLQREKQSNSYYETSGINNTNPNTPSNYSSVSNFNGFGNSVGQFYSKSSGQSHSNENGSSGEPFSGQKSLSPLQRVQKRFNNDLKYKKEDQNIGNGYQEKFGSRLNNMKMVNKFNKASLEDVELVDQIGPPEGDENYVDRSRSYSNPPSSFAQGVVQELGVDDKSAATAMEVIDRMSNITAEQLEQLDEVTRMQILQIRKDLGIDSFMNSNGSSNNGNGNSNSNGRSVSAPKLRSNFSPIVSNSPQMKNEIKQPQLSGANVIATSSGRPLKTFSSDEKSRLLTDARRSANSLNLESSASALQSSGPNFNSGSKQMFPNYGRPPRPDSNGTAAQLKLNSFGAIKRSPFSLKYDQSSDLSINSIDADSEINNDDDDFSQLDELDTPN